MNAETLREGLAAGSRRALAKAITLVESQRPDHQDIARALLTSLPGPSGPTLRLGLSGTPGVGKSTFIEAFGLDRAQAGAKVAVLAVDPSSARSGGSILGDKTRMEELSRHPNAFIRPSPSQTQLGGVARRTREVIALAEAAGFDLILVETVGVGQSETLVSQMTDIFLLLLAPAGGDELQGVKRGIMEMADLVIINKADGPLEPQAQATRADYAAALHLFRPRPGDPPGFPKAVCASAMTGAGLPEIWQDICTLAQTRRDSGNLDRTRTDQQVAHFQSELAAMLTDRLDRDPVLADLNRDLQQSVAQGKLPPAEAARSLVDRLVGTDGASDATKPRTGIDGLPPKP